MDGPLILSITRTAWSALAGVVTIYIIATHVTPSEQGFYYTFGNILALQVFVELGLNQVIIQHASHEWAKLDLDNNGRIVGDRESRSRLVSFGRTACSWYLIAAGLGGVGIAIAGYIFFEASPDHGVKWLEPWLLLCLLTSIKLAMQPLWSLLEGCNRVGEVFSYRLSVAILSTITLLSFIILGAGLWALPLSLVIDIAWSIIFLRLRCWNFILSFAVDIPGPRIDWKRDVLPIQLRMASSWVCGYFIFSLFTPVTFHYQGAVAAGQMGMTWGLVSAVSSVASAWRATKAPMYGILIARKDYEALDKLHARVLWITAWVAAMMAFFIWAAVYAMHMLNLTIMNRVLPPLPTGLFLLATVLIQIPSSQAAYLRAHKREPFMGISIVQALLTGICVTVLGRPFGPTGMAAAYLLIIALLVVPWGAAIWRRCATDWHVVE